MRNYELNLLAFMLQLVLLDLFVDWMFIHFCLISNLS